MLVRRLQHEMATESNPFYEPHWAQAWETTNGNGNKKRKKGDD